MIPQYCHGMFIAINFKGTKCIYAMKLPEIPSFHYKSDIDTSNTDEVKYHTSRLNISSQQLVGAIRATGSNNVAIIEEYLFNKKQKTKRPRFIQQL